MQGKNELVEGMANKTTAQSDAKSEVVSHNQVNNRFFSEQNHSKEHAENHKNILSIYMQSDSDLFKEIENRISKL